MDFLLQSGVFKNLDSSTTSISDKSTSCGKVMKNRLKTCRKLIGEANVNYNGRFLFCGVGS